MTSKERINAAIKVRGMATPGPWSIDSSRDDTGNERLVIRKPSSNTDREWISNITIIAAAPDLVDEVVKLRKIIATLSRRANKLERDGVVRMTAEERGKWLDKQCEDLEKRDENIAEGYGLERKWFAEAQEAKE